MQELNPLIMFDREQRNAPGDILAGTDEAGRGPLCGPVCAAAVIFPVHIEAGPVLRDSKKMTEKQREEAYAWIVANALSWNAVMIHPDEIDRINILNAAMLAMKQAADKLELKPDIILVDGNRLPKGLENARPVVKGDAKSFTVAAASIIAKVTRDRYMTELDRFYPAYGFKQHKGYGTKDHVEAIRKYLPSPVHRLSFQPVKSFAFPAWPNRSVLGTWGENWAIHYLTSRGYDFLERNIRLGNAGEIDLMMKKGELYILVEVKTSGPNDNSDPEEWITEMKIKKMLSLSELYFHKLGLTEYFVRIDAVTVRAGNWRHPKIRHFADIIYGNQNG